jgi:hypothetical protein
MHHHAVRTRQDAIASVENDFLVENLAGGERNGRRRRASRLSSRHAVVALGPSGQGFALAGNGVGGHFLFGARAQASKLRLLFGDTAVDELALDRGQLGLQERLVARNILAVGKDPDCNFVGHGDTLPSAERGWALLRKIRSAALGSGLRAVFVARFLFPEPAASRPFGRQAY